MTEQSRRPYDDLAVGEIRQSLPVTITEAAILTFSNEFDPQWFHTDPVEARKSKFGGLIASGVHLLALWRQMDHGMNGDIDYCCALGLRDIQFAKAVRPNDVLTLESRIAACRLSETFPDCGIVTLDYRMTDATGETVLALSSVNLVYRHR